MWLLMLNPAWFALGYFVVFFLVLLGFAFERYFKARIGRYTRSPLGRIMTLSNAENGILRDTDDINTSIWVCSLFWPISLLTTFIARLAIPTTTWILNKLIWIALSKEEKINFALGLRKKESK